MIFAQPDDFPVRAVKDLSIVWKNNYFKVLEKPNFSNDFELLPKVWPAMIPQNNHAQINNINQYYDTKAAALRADAGLSWNTSTQQNFSTQPGEDNLFFRSKIATGVEWDLLSGGLMENEHRAQVLEKQKQVELLGLQQSKGHTISFENRSSVLYFFNQQKIKALQQKEKLLSEEIAILEKLIENKTLLLPVLLDAYKSKIEINGLMQTYATYNASVRDWVDTTFFNPNVLPPLFDINPKALKVLCGQDDVVDRQILLSEESEQLQYNWMNDVKLSGNLRYNYFDMIGTQNNRGYLSMGVQAQIPIKIFHQDYKAAKHIQLQKEKWKMDQTQDAMWSEVSQLFYEFRYKLKQYSILEAQRKLTIEQLKLSQSQSELSPEYFLPVESIQNLVEYWDIVIEQLDLHQQLYLKLGEIRSYIPQENVLRFTRAWSMESPLVNFNQEENIAVKKTHLFVWSKSWVDRKPEEVANQIFAWQVDKVYISPSSEAVDQNNFQSLVQLLHKKNVEVELLIGKNKWLYSTIEPKIDSLYNLYGNLPLSGLHLDIEPHAMEGFKENPNVFFEYYYQRLNEARLACNKHNWNLGASIPLHYELNVLQKISTSLDEVVLMAYETKGPESILRRSQDEIQTFGNKTNIALRAKDYTTKEEMRKDFDALLLGLPSQKISIHDFETYSLLNP